VKDRHPDVQLMLKVDRKFEECLEKQSSFFHINANSPDDRLD